MTCSGEDLANVKGLCFPSSHTEQNLIWYVEKLQWKFIPIAIALFSFQYFLVINIVTPIPMGITWEWTHRIPIVPTPIIPCTSLHHSLGDLTYSPTGSKHLIKDLDLRSSMDYPFMTSTSWSKIWPLPLSLLFSSLLFSSMRGRQQLSCPVLRPPNWPNARPQNSIHLT